MTNKEIAERIRELQKLRRQYMSEVMKEFDSLQQEEIRSLREQCTHNFRFTNLGPLGHPWFHCTYCGKSKVELE